MCALNHEEPDRVPLFIGTSGATTVLTQGYEPLTAYLGMRRKPTRWYSTLYQSVWMDDDVLERLGSDGRTIAPGPAASTLRREVSADCRIDDWGVTWRRAPGSLYFDVCDWPLRHATLDDLERYPWPDLTPPGRFDGLAQRAKAIQDAGYATVLLSGIGFLERASMLRGLDTMLMDMVADEEFFSALIGKLNDLMCSYARQLLSEVGPYTDVIITSDDLGMTRGPLLSPQTYRRLIKPQQARLFGVIREQLAGKLFYHSCGDVVTLLGDLIDVGVELLNPVQVSAGAMGDTARLKREFGKRLSFCGAIDTRWVLPSGTPDDVRREVRQRIRDLAPGGGYVAASVHCIQPDVPPENIVAMCQEVATAGRYPLRV